MGFWRMLSYLGLHVADVARFVWNISVHTVDIVSMRNAPYHVCDVWKVLMEPKTYTLLRCVMKGAFARLTRNNLCVYTNTERVTALIMDQQRCNHIICIKPRANCVLYRITWQHVVLSLIQTSYCTILEHRASAGSAKASHKTQYNT